MIRREWGGQAAVRGAARSRLDIAATPAPGRSTVEEWGGLDSVRLTSSSLKGKAHLAHILLFVTVATHSEMAFLVFGG